MPFYEFDEHIDALRDLKIPYVRRINHTHRYQFAADIFNKNHPQLNRILDAACGYGYGSFILNQETHALVDGIDISQESISYAKKNYAKSKVIRFQKGDLNNPATVSEKYGAIVSFETLEHLKEAESEQLIKRFYQALIPGGILVCSCPNRYLTTIFDLLRMYNPYHQYEYFPQDLARTVRQAGFSQVTMYGQGFSFPPTFYLAGKKVISDRYFYPSVWIPAYFCNNCIIVAVK